MFYKNKDEIDETSLSPLQNYYYNIYKTSTKLIQTFSEKHYEFSCSTDKEFSWNFFLNIDELYVNIFRNINTMENNFLPSPSSKGLTTEIETDNDIDKSKFLDVNLLSFQSSINFVNELCQTCEKMKDIPNDDQMAYLKKELLTLNKILPSNVYIPFLKDSIRNYVICHIPVTEARIFRTKNRAPYMITVEVIRIDEVVNTILKKEKSKIKGYDTKVEPELPQEYSLNKYSSGSNYVPPDHLKGRSHSMATSNKDMEIDNEIYLVKKADLTININKNAKSFLEPTKIADEKLKRKRSSTIRMLAESDIRLSRPVIISNLEAENKRTPLRGEKKIILEENEEYDESFLKEGVDEIVKRRLTVYPMSASRKSKLLDEKIEINPSGASENILVKENDADESINYKTRARNHTTCEQNKNSLTKIDEIVIAENNQENENSSFGRKTQNDLKDDSINAENTHSIHVNFQNVFGELIQEQSARIKNFSPFGQFSTWKLFKMIVKSGEDLRQEQFATQLINEFHQIFQMEKVGCWVNTYEILATGNNVGIIECVPNAISIDQLKRKVKNCSLRIFFENYFGPTDSKRFKDAMNNFIASLAGYSLVCYFLQIKDRHNANILLDDDGHLIHIDFGFLLSNAPGKGLKFENAPFKLTAETVETMGGSNSKYFKEFRKLLLKGFLAIVKHAEKILILVEMMYCGHGKNLPCFEGKEYTIEALKARFFPKPKMTKPDYMRHVDDLISQSIDNWRTKWYDRFQYYVQGIFY